ARCVKETGTLPVTTFPGVCIFLLGSPIFESSDRAPIRIYKGTHVIGEHVIAEHERVGCEDYVMTKRSLGLGSVVALACFTAACTTPRVVTDSNPKFSVASCHTYAWAGSFRSDPGSRPNIANPLNEERLRAAIAAGLQSKSVQVATDRTSAD